MNRKSQDIINLNLVHSFSDFKFCLLEYGLIDNEKNDEKVYIKKLIIEEDVSFFNNFLENYIKNFLKNLKNKNKINLLIFCTSQINQDFNDLEDIKLSYECIDLKLNFFDIIIKGNYVLGFNTVYKIPLIDKLIKYKSFKTQIQTKSKEELISLINEKNIFIKKLFKSKDKLIKSLIKYEENKILTF